MALCKNKIDVESPQARSKLKIQTKKLNEKRRVFHRLEAGNPLSHRRQFVLAQAARQCRILIFFFLGMRNPKRALSKNG